VSRLVARYRTEGEAAFTPRSRRPTRSPSATSPEVVELVLRLRKQLVEQGLDAGAHTICWHLREHHQHVVSAATVWRILNRHGQIVPAPNKRPRSSYLRFEAELPNQMWQTDFTHYRLPGRRTPGSDVEVLNFLDEYNHRRPHRSLPHRATPATVYTTHPKATPGADRSTDTHDRVRHDKIDKAGSVTLRVAGRLRHIGVGRTYARTDVILLVHDLHVRIVNPATGEILRDLIIDPRRDYQPTGRPPGPAKQIGRTRKPQVRPIPMS
jgi:hypothetical protein